MQEFSWSGFIGGLAFFFYGLQLIRGALRLIAGDRVKTALTRAAGNRIKALILGVAITLIFQSSSATTVLLVSLAASNLLTLPQVFGVILGADIGTTLIVILLSIKKITNYSLIIIAAGLMAQIAGRRHRTKHIGSAVLGFGLVFFGMYLMSIATAPLKESAIAMGAFQYMADHPFTNLAAATIFTAIIQASAATIGMAISLSFAGLITFEAAIPIVLGANIGTCITAFLGSFGMGVEGRRVAVAHVFVKTAGVAIAFPFIKNIAVGIDAIANHFAGFIPHLQPGVAGKIALMHLFFNVGIAILFLPFIRLGVAVVKKICPEPLQAPKPFAPRYLDEKFLDTPILAFAQVRREIIRSAGYALDLFNDALKMFEQNPHVPEIVEDIKTRDDKIDILNKAIRFYLAKITREELTDEQTREQFMLINIAGNIEEIGDIISKDLAMLAMKKWNHQMAFSESGLSEIRHFHSKVVENFNLTISAMANPHPEVIQKIVRHQEEVYNLEQEYKQEHIARLHRGKQETLDTSSVHWDLLSNLRRVNGQLTYIAKVLAL